MNRLRRNIAGGFLSVPTGGFTLIVVVAILWLTLARSPFGDTPMPHIPGLDKVVHACMFGGLTFVGELDCSRWRIKRRNLRGDAALVGWHLAAVIALGGNAYGARSRLARLAGRRCRRGSSGRGISAGCPLGACPETIESLFCVYFAGATLSAPSVVLAVKVAALSVPSITAFTSARSSSSCLSRLRIVPSGPIISMVGIPDIP